MNRQQRRNFEAQLRKKGLSADDAKAVALLKEAQDSAVEFAAGDKVQLDMEKITNHPDYDKKLPAYRQFCEENTGCTFTVEFDKKNPRLICLTEDQTVPKWLFWSGDLKKVDR